MSDWTSIKKPARPLAFIPKKAAARAQTERRDAEPLARILWHLLKYKQPFNPEVFAKEEAKLKRQKLQRLQNLAAALNYQLVPQP